MIVIDYPDTKAPKAARTALMATILTVLSPLLITAGFILYVWTRFRGQARRSGMEDPLERTLGVRTMSEAVELLEGIPFKPKMPGPLSSAISIAMDLVPSALATTRITAGLVYPYPRAFEPIMLESQDGTPVCGHRDPGW
jgi:hypothetical protein